MPDQFSFLPYAQAKLAEEFRAPADRSQPRLEIALNAEITADNVTRSPAIPLSKPVKGPGEIIAIQRSAIRRVEPETGLRGFEPNYLPFVEFHDADFPWRYSLDSALSRGRKDPWLVLITLTADEFTPLEQGSAPLPSINVKDIAASLPDLRHSWAHAHVQTNAEGDAEIDINSALQADGNNTFSRLFATRKLKPSSSYFMFLVPAYLAGVQAGLGQRITAGFGTRAWDVNSSANVVLPIYQQWRFSTDSAEDLEFLAKRLKAFNANSPDEPGAPSRASAQNPGYYSDYNAPPEQSFTLENALQQPKAGAPAFETDPDLSNRMETTLAQVIAGEQEDEEDDEDPLVAFPAYGHKFQGHTAAKRARAQDDQWFDRVNLDLKFRQVAGLGAEVVRENQEVFAHLAWTQYEEITAANERLARLQTAERLIESLHKRRSDRLDSAVALTLGEALQDIPEMVDGTSISQQLRNSGVPLSYVSRALRRQSAKRSRTALGEFPAPAIPGDKGHTGPAVAKADDTHDLRATQGVQAQIETAFRTIFASDVFENTMRLDQSQQVVAQFDSKTHAQAISGLLAALPAAKADFHVAGRDDTERKALGPIWRGPSIPFPMVSYLRRSAPEAILSGIDRMPDNTLAFFEENRRFLEAFLLGANHEMNAELRWREFPTDMRSTIFKRFWDRKRPATDPKGDDIAAIHTWDNKLGQNFGVADSDAKADVVVVIKGDIIRKLGDAVVAISIANGAEWKIETATQKLPVFSGKLGREIVYFGFDISLDELTSQTMRERAHFVIYEKPGRLRFGMDIANAQIRRKRLDLATQRYNLELHGFETIKRSTPARILPDLPPIPVTPANTDDLSWSHVQLETSGHIDFGRQRSFSDGSDLWGANRNSATLARCMWQKPLAIVLPLERVLTS